MRSPPASLLPLLLLDGARACCSWMYINGRDATARRANLLRQLERWNVTAVRFESVPKSDVKDQSGIKLLDKHKDGGAGIYADHIHGAYARGEISLILTFQRALSHALQSGWPAPFVIMEDDIELSTSSRARAELEAAIRRAPSGWEMLQFHVVNSRVRASFCQLEEEFVAWFPEYYGTALTVVSKAAAERFATEPIRGHAVLDYWAYIRARSYSHTLNWFSTRNFGDKMNGQVGDDEASAHRDCKAGRKQPTPAVQPRVALVVLTRDTVRTMRLINATTVPRGVVWNVIHGKADPSLPLLPYVVSLPWIEERGAFPRWRYYAEFRRWLGHPHAYEYALLAADDASFDGFPWTTLFREVRAANSTLITGLSVESERANNYVHRKGKGCPPDIQAMNANFWRERRWLSMYVQRRRRAYGNINLAPDAWRHRTYVREGVATLVDWALLGWLLETTALAHVEADSTNGLDLVWGGDRLVPSRVGIDLVWCGAAQEYAPHRNPCMIFPYPVWHMELSHGGERERGSSAGGGSGSDDDPTKAYWLRNASWTRWLQYSRKERQALACS